MIILLALFDVQFIDIINSISYVLFFFGQNKNKNKNNKIERYKLKLDFKKLQKQLKIIIREITRKLITGDRNTRIDHNSRTK